MIGKTLGHFEILERIGGGGMGEIYRAHDQHLDRNVAIKVLPSGSVSEPATRKQFRNEALALAKLRHPHIGVVHDFGSEDGVDFLVMELVPGCDLGEKLKEGPLSESETVRLGIQITEALEEAHEQRIVHRDLKPQNIMVTPKNQAKVLDFGLAKLLRPLDDASTASMTQLQTIAGTLPYMAPEQLQGREIDARTDIYAIAATLYEMMTGRRPFAQTNHAELVMAILNDPPAPPREVNAEISEDLERIVLKALEKDRSRRYQTAQELREDLQRYQGGVPVTAPVAAKPRRHWVSALAAAALAATVLVGLNILGLRDRIMGGQDQARYASLAVLPFTNIADDTQKGHYAEGMTDGLITNLARLGGLETVISRQSMRQYENTDKSLAEISQELGVDVVLEGTVMLLNNRMQISVRLIDPKTERHLWADTYDRELKDLLSLLNEMTRHIAGEINLALSPEEEVQLAKQREVPPEIIEAYFNGRFHLNAMAGDDVLKAIDFFDEIIERDSTFALAYSGLAEAYSLRAWGYAPMDMNEAVARARAAATKALLIDDSIPESHIALATIRENFDWDWSGAETAYRRAIELRPNSQIAHEGYGILLAYLRRFDEAVEHVRKAQAASPRSPRTACMTAVVYLIANRYNRALETIDTALGFDSSFLLAYYVQGHVYFNMGKYEEAVSAYRKSSELDPADLDMKSSLARAYARSGRRDEALKILGELEREYQSPYSLALVYLALGEKDRGLELLEAAYARRDPRMINLGVDFQELQSEPRIQELQAKMGLPR